jgi:hypothetical protein
LLLIPNDEKVFYYEFLEQDVYPLAISDDDTSIVERHSLSIKLSMDTVLSLSYHVPVELRTIIGNYLYQRLDDKNIRAAMESWYKITGSLKFGHISFWDTSAVTNMHRLFSPGQYARFNLPLSAWDVSNVTTMSEIHRRIAQM